MQIAAILAMSFSPHRLTHPYSSVHPFHQHYTCSIDALGDVLAELRRDGRATFLLGFHARVRTVIAKVRGREPSPGHVTCALEAPMLLEIRVDGMFICIDHLPV